MAAKKKKPATKKETAGKRKKRVPRYVNMEKALKDISAPFDRDVFTYIAGWVQPDGRTCPNSPSIKTIAHHVAPDAYSSQWAQTMVSFAVHDLEEAGLLRIYRDYTQGDEHPRNIYIVNHCYMLDTPGNTEPQNIERASARASFQRLGALGAIVSADMRNESENSSRSADILSELAALLADYQKKQGIFAAGIREAEDEANRIREGQDCLAAVTLQRITGFLKDALA